jgi:hypothetical protein
VSVDRLSPSRAPGATRDLIRVRGVLLLFLRSLPQPGGHTGAPGSKSMVLAGVSLGRYPHVCAFFEDRDEEFTCFLPLMREGIEAGERAFHIVDPALRDDHLGAAEGSRHRHRRNPTYRPARGQELGRSLSSRRPLRSGGNAVPHPRDPGPGPGRGLPADSPDRESGMGAPGAGLVGDRCLRGAPERTASGLRRSHQSAPTTPQSLPARPSSTFCARIRWPSSGASPAKTPSSRLLRSSWSSCFRGNTDAGGADPPPTGFDAPSRPVLPRRSQ